MSETYSNVDASAAPGEAVDWQERMSAWPAVQAYKRRSHELLAGAASVVDVGCGPGGDVVALGVDRCFGVESSAVMARAAADRGATVGRADAHSLPLRSASLGGARADRVVQHLADPVAGVREMVRVVAPAGRVVVADPDQETLVIQVPGVRASVLDRLRALRRDRGYRNGRFISHVPALLHSLGLADVTVDPFPLAIADPALAFGLPSWPTLWRHEGQFSDDELAEWDAAMAAQPAGFVYIVTVLVVSGCSPTRARIGR
jgi:SAM-dependent methyltransferase